MGTMKFLASSKKDSGFSLVELMIVVAIISILAALAVPKFASFQAKAKQAEAKTNLSHIYTLEEAYFGDNETYVNMANQGRNGAAAACNANPIGFQLRPCTATKIRYGYVVAGASTTAFTGTATSQAAGSQVVKGCAVLDTWTIDANRTLTNTVDGVAGC